MSKIDNVFKKNYKILKKTHPNIRLQPIHTESGTQYFIRDLNKWYENGSLSHFEKFMMMTIKKSLYSNKFKDIDFFIGKSSTSHKFYQNMFRAIPKHKHKPLFIELIGLFDNYRKSYFVDSRSFEAFIAPFQAFDKDEQNKLTKSAKTHLTALKDIYLGNDGTNETIEQLLTAIEKTLNAPSHFFDCKLKVYVNLDEINEFFKTNKIADKVQKTIKRHLKKDTPRRNNAKKISLKNKLKYNRYCHEYYSKTSSFATGTEFEEYCAKNPFNPPIV
jgi:hypothetical protein